MLLRGVVVVLRGVVVVLYRGGGGVERGGIRWLVHGERCKPMFTLCTECTSICVAMHTQCTYYTHTQGNASSRAAAQVGSTSSVRALAAAALRLVDQATRHVDHGQYAVNDPLHGLPSTVNSHNGQHNVLLSGGVGVHASTASGGVGVHASTGSGITGFEPTPRVQQLLTKLKVCGVYVVCIMCGMCGVLCGECACVSA